jgi:hypothetical protein
MAGEINSVPIEESIVSVTVKKKTMDGMYWLGEHSPKVTIPLTGVIFLAGAISAPVAATLVGLDVGQKKLFKRQRQKRKSTK